MSLPFKRVVVAVGGCGGEDQAPVAGGVLMLLVDGSGWLIALRCQGPCLVGGFRIELQILSWF